MFVSLLFSLSLAAYVLLFLGVVFFYIGCSRHKMKICVILVFLVSISFVVAKGYYQYYPTTVFSKRVLSRVFAKDNVKISNSLQNRSSVKFKKEYAMLKDDAIDYFLGKGPKYFSEHIGAGTASAEAYIFMYSILGVIFLILFYLCACCVYYSPFGVGFLLLYVFSFLQRPVALSFYQLFLFITLLTAFRQDYSCLNYKKRRVVLCNVRQ